MHPLLHPTKTDDAAVEDHASSDDSDGGDNDAYDGDDVTFHAIQWANLHRDQKCGHDNLGPRGIDSRGGVPIENARPKANAGRRCGVAVPEPTLRRRGRKKWDW